MDEQHRSMLNGLFDRLSSVISEDEKAFLLTLAERFNELERRVNLLTKFNPEFRGR